MAVFDPNTHPAAARFSIYRYGQQTVIVESDVTIPAATVTALVTSTPDRVAIVFSTTGTSNPFSFSSLPTVTATTGAIIGAAGGASAFDVLGDGEATAQGFFGFSTLGTTVHIIETQTRGTITGEQPFARAG